MVASDFPTCRLLAQPDNLGFAEGCNRGIEASTGEWVATLNNDCVADTGLGGGARRRGATRARVVRHAPVLDGVPRSAGHDQLGGDRADGVRQRARSTQRSELAERRIGAAGGDLLPDCRRGGVSPNDAGRDPPVDRLFRSKPLHVLRGPRSGLARTACRLGCVVSSPSRSSGTNGTAAPNATAPRGSPCCRASTACARMLKNASPSLIARTSPVTIAETIEIAWHAGLDGVRRLQAAVRESLAVREEVAKLARVSRRSVERAWTRW